MKKQIQTGVVILLAGLLFHQSLLGREDPQDWIKLSPPGGRFEILMPGTPVTGKPIVLKLPTFTVELHPFMALRPPFGVMCGYADFPFDPPNVSEVFDRTREGSIGNVHGKLIMEKELTMDGYRGRRFRSTAQGESFIDEEMYLVGRRYYLITILSKSVEPDKNIEKVLDSFRFTVQQ